MSFGFPKPMKGTALIAKRKRHADQKAKESAEMQAAKKDDGGKCRYPGCRKRLPVDSCHEHGFHRGIGGNPDGSSTQAGHLISLCRFHHGLYDAYQINCEAKTSKGLRGPCDWFRKNQETGEMEMFASERLIGVSVSVGN